jgi:hypothetical protein
MRIAFTRPVLLPVLLAPCLASVGGCAFPGGARRDAAAGMAAPPPAVVAPRPQPLRRPPPSAAAPAARGGAAAAAAQPTTEPPAGAAAQAQGEAVVTVAGVVAQSDGSPLTPAPGRRPAWRVVADGTVGCAAPGPLRVVRGSLGQARPNRRAVTAALDEGRCLTTFRVNEWVLLQVEGDVAALRLTNPTSPGEPPLRLWFARRDVVDAAGRNPGDPGSAPPTATDAD